jgi:hypothetical protein
MSEQLMILVAGPYRSGTNDDPVLIQRNVDAMEEMALAVFRRGHLPVLGEWFALPLLKHAGSKKTGDAVFDEIFHAIARELVAKCDAYCASAARRLAPKTWSRRGRGAANASLGICRRFRGERGIRTAPCTA